MVETQIAQDFFLGSSKQDPKILYVEVTNVSFNTRDKVLVVYIEKGYKDLVLNPETKQNELKRFPISNDKKIYTQAQMKDCILASGNDFNHDGENMIANEMVRIADDIIMKDISANPGDFFDKQPELWVIV